MDTNEPNPEAICSVRLQTGQHTDPLPWSQAAQLLESVPFAALEAWNGHCWETIWDGSVEFAGVAPDPEG